MRLSSDGLLVAGIALAVFGQSAATAGDLAGSHEGPGWVLFAYSGSTQPLSAWITADLSGPGVASIDVRTSERASTTRGLMFGSNTEFYAGPVDGMLVEHGLDLHVERTSIENTSGRVILWTAGAVESFDWSVNPPAGATVTLLATSYSAFFMKGNDPDLGVHARIVANGVMVSASAAEYAFDVQHEFVGVVGQRLPGAPETLREEITITRPGGDVLECDCNSPRFGTSAWGPGTYWIDRSGLGIEVGQTILLAGVDVPGLPKLPWDA